MKTHHFYVYHRGPEDQPFRSYGMTQLDVLNDDTYRVLADALADLRTYDKSPVLGLPWVDQDATIPQALVMYTQGRRTRREYLLTLAPQPKLNALPVAWP